jgi:hypothetical protein
MEKCFDVFLSRLNELEFRAVKAHVP